MTPITEIRRVTPDGAFVVTAERPQGCWVWRDAIESGLRWIHNDANASGYAQLQTGVVVYEDQCTDLLNRVKRAGFQATGRAS